MNGDGRGMSGVLGVRVFGSAVVRVIPDAALIRVAVSRIEMDPADSFAAARNGAQSVNSLLHESGINDYGSSRVTLAEDYDYKNSQRFFAGYKAKIEYSIFLRELDKLDALLSGLISAGANELTSVTFESTELKQFRVDARRRAVVAARDKAELYCEAAGVDVGAVTAIEDVNPELLSGGSNAMHGLHVIREAPAPVDDSGDPGAIDPGAITVGAAVYITYSIETRA